MQSVSRILTALCFLTLGLGKGLASHIQVIGDPNNPTIVQATTDLKTWFNIQTNPPGTGFTINEGPAHSFDKRFYRVVKISGTPISPAPADDLTALPDKVFMAGEGFNAVQVSPSGRPAFIVWKNQELLYRERNAQGNWSQQVVCNLGGSYQAKSYDEHRFQPAAVLFFDSSSKPHVFVAQNQKALHFEWNGSWNQKEEINFPVGGQVLFVGASGPNDKFHLAIASADANAIHHGSNRNGSWEWTKAAGLNGHPRGFYKQSYSPRFFSMAVDSDNRAHIVYCPVFQTQLNSDHARLTSELYYVCNQTGQWLGQRIAAPSDDSADAGLGASVAIGPDNRPAIAAWYDERASTGSSQESRLYYHRKLPNGTWDSSMIVQNSENYAAGDGPKGSGFAPYLRFDQQGRPHIIFSDHAAEHFGNSGQMEYAGQVRHIYHNGNQWVTRAVIQQGSPLLKQMIYPAFAVSGNEVIGIGLQRETVWGPDTWPRTINSTYRLLNFQFQF